jgi:hypothetical protein
VPTARNLSTQRQQEYFVCLCSFSNGVPHNNHVVKIQTQVNNHSFTKWVGKVKVSFFWGGGEFETYIELGYSPFTWTNSVTLKMEAVCSSETNDFTGLTYYYYYYYYY